MLVFLFSVTRPGFLMSREKYYTHAVGQRQKYYEAERILLVLADKRSVAQPSILLWRKMYDITLYFSASLFFSLFFFLSPPRPELNSTDRTTEEKKKLKLKGEKKKHPKGKENCFSCRLMKARKKNKIKIIYHNFSPSPCFGFGSLCLGLLNPTPSQPSMKLSGMKQIL